MRDEKNDEREGKILFKPRTQGTYIELYRLIKIPTRTQPVISIY